MADILAELKKFGVDAFVNDPLVTSEVAHEYGIELTYEVNLTGLDALILAVPHKEFLAEPEGVVARLKPGGVLINLKSVVWPGDVPTALPYWSL